jgi:glycosyltransferase involved in cell wall biosynthesis
MPTISVIIATYNCAPYLRESLDSVFGQTWQDMEVLVVDDGSTDDTSAVLSGYGGRLTVIETPHAGYAAARNAGLARARGEWVAFHDADDVLLPDRLAFQHAFLGRHAGYEVVLCNGERMGSHGGARLVGQDLAARTAGRPLTEADVFDGFPIFFQAALVPRRVFAAIGPFDSSLGIYPDLEYGYRLLSRCRAAFVDRVVFRYRAHATNVTRDRLRGREELARILDRLAADEDAARRIGAGRLRARLARHCYRIARQRLRLGDRERGRAALRRAAALRPLHPGYQLLRLWHAR